MINNKTISSQHFYNATTLKVWNAISNKNEIRKWGFEIKEFEPVIGFQFQFSGGPSPENQYIHLCKIVEVLHLQKLAYTWAFMGYEGNTIVSFELIEQGEHTILKFSHSGIETFPESNPDFAFANFRTGWEHILNNSLKKYLEE